MSVKHEDLTVKIIKLLKNDPRHQGYVKSKRIGHAKVYF